mmetsp:Transcript_61007/g.69821  ORF Transcript_61007/g.69821 Transcript_61007/m.69821 type:complete len:253 (-) Transcript_61007:352-1110(-)
MRQRSTSRNDDDRQRLLTDNDGEDRILKTDRSQAGRPPAKEEEKGSHAIYPSCQYIKQEQVRIVESEVNSNLPLQILIYFNSYFSVVLYVLELYVTYYKHYSMTMDNYRFIQFPICFIWPLIEVPRLYFGFSGNIRENFPEMVAFMIMSLLFAFPIWGLRFIDILFPIERALLWIYGCFIVVEFVLGCATIATFVRTQTALFYLRNLPPEKKHQKVQEPASEMVSSRSVQRQAVQRVEEHQTSTTVGLPIRR